MAHRRIDDTLCDYFWLVSVISADRPSLTVMKTLITALLCLISIRSYAREIVSQDYKTTLIELFSSEGCSSCPPAEKQLSLLRDAPDLWKSFVPVNFHVDYWNNLGWVDPYSNKQFTERQHKYASFWKTRTVYTPAFVKDSVSVGSRLDSTASRQKARAIPKIKIIVSEKRDISATIENLNPTLQYEIHFALLGNEILSNVTAGENSGRKLEQNFVVLDFKSVAIANKTAFTQLKVTGTKVQPKSFAIAAWVTERGQLTPLQAVGSQIP